MQNLFGLAQHYSLNRGGENSANVVLRSVKVDWKCVCACVCMGVCLWLQARKKTAEKEKEDAETSRMLASIETVCLHSII